MSQVQVLSPRPVFLKKIAATKKGAAIFLGQQFYFYKFKLSQQVGMIEFYF